MPSYWEPGTQYNNGDIVEYEGNFYKIIQPHRSQSDWTPPVTPALWGRMQKHDVYNQSGQQQQQQQQQQHDQGGQWQQQQPQPPPSYQQPHDSGHSGTQQASQDHKPEPQKEDKPWWSLGGEHKQAIGIAAGVLGGVGALGGAALLYKHHEKSEEEKQRAAEGYSNWLQNAQHATEEFYRSGPRAPYTWVLTHGKTIPHGAITVDKEHDWFLQICRVYIGGGIQVGKASSAFKKGGVVGYKKEENHVDVYEILLGDMSGLRWVPASGKLNVSRLGYEPVKGGNENDGTPLYVIKAHHKGVWHPGKASERLDGAYIPYDNDEKNIKEYEVLCTNKRLQGY